jgi:hypothetical protein
VPGAEADLVGTKRAQGSQQHRAGSTAKAPAVAFAASPIQVSTPPVRIIGTGRRHKGGFCLSDR